MIVEAQVTINGSRAATWAAIADIENEFYTTRADIDGVVYLATLRISESGGGITLTSSHESRPEGLVARLRSLPMILFKGVMKKALLQDLNDIKSAVESG